MYTVQIIEYDNLQGWDWGNNIVSIKEKSYPTQKEAEREYTRLEKWRSSLEYPNEIAIYLV